MGKTAYFDCFSGASGDMVLGALLDLGLPIEALRSALGSLAIEYGEISAERVLRAGVTATKFRATADDDHAAAARVSLPGAPHGTHEHHHGADGAHHLHAHAPDRRAHDPEQGEDANRTHSHGGHSHTHTQSASHEEHPHVHPDSHSHDRDGSGESDGSRPPSHGHHSLKEIAGYIERSALSRQGKARAVHLFERLGAAEAAVHGVSIDTIHLHEVGALDSIIDIVGVVYGMEWLGVDEVVVSPLNVGSGTVWCAHGEFPVPAPATTLLLKGVPVYAGAVATELVTPTGALLMTAYADRFGPLPPMRVQQTGYGAGSKDFPRHPNVLRVMVGDVDDASAERIVELECEIDDMNPQLFGPLMDRLYDAGALDVFYIAVQMKKNRPGILVTVLAPPARREAIAGVLFAESTTIGVRYHDMTRDCLDRAIREVDTPVGRIRFKVASRRGRILNAAPEFDDCVRAAGAWGMPLKDVQALALRAWLDRAEEPRHSV